MLCPRNLYARFPQHLMRWAHINGTISPHSRRSTVLTADLDNLPSQVRIQSQHPDDGNAGSWQLHLHSISLDVGWRGWSVWLMYCITGLMQTTLLALAVKYAWHDRQRVSVGRRQSVGRTEVEERY